MGRVRGTGLREAQYTNHIPIISSDSLLSHILDTPMMLSCPGHRHNDTHPVTTHTTTHRCIQHAAWQNFTPPSASTSTSLPFPCEVIGHIPVFSQCIAPAIIEPYTLLKSMNDLLLGGYTIVALEIYQVRGAPSIWGDDLADSKFLCLFADTAARQDSQPTLT